jgi:hypothetical protein
MQTRRNRPLTGDFEVIQDQNGIWNIYFTKMTGQGRIRLFQHKKKVVCDEALWAAKTSYMGGRMDQLTEIEDMASGEAGKIYHEISEKEAF